MLETGDINRFPGVGSYASYCRCVDSRRMSNHKKLDRAWNRGFFGALKARGELQCCKAFALILMSYLQGCNVCRFCRSTKTATGADQIRHRVIKKTGARSNSWCYWKASKWRLLKLFAYWLALASGRPRSIIWPGQSISLTLQEKPCCILNIQSLLYLMQVFECIDNYRAAWTCSWCAGDAISWFYNLVIESEIFDVLEVNISGFLKRFPRKSHIHTRRIFASLPFNRLLGPPRNCSARFSNTCYAGKCIVHMTIISKNKAYGR